ncbi:cell division cycle protein 123 homolog [Plakobranchus ocellatus]|uniref:Cell division cycle protein 123 homolog n=1 Tax=Plakobranchus ocellatus TaxID=259542 RepID=A0AAV4B444_9GAST|nr:cell division cycle protein 123 homolog [Plakobranchus ocellatus]
MASNGKTLEEQLRSVKLKKSSKPQKDFSSPKTAGYISQEEIEAYQTSVLDVNTEEWLDLVKDFTFPSCYETLNVEDAKLFVDIYKRLYANLEPSAIASIHWKENLSEEERAKMVSMSSRLQKKIDAFLIDHGAKFAFVKLSSRSPKDAPMAQRFKEIYSELISKEELSNENQVSVENAQITCLLKAAFQSLKMKSADDVIDMCVRSERVYQDLLLALALPDRFRENWVIRQFVDIDVDMEFRGFVHQKRLTALSQYNYLIFSQRLADNRDFYLHSITEFFEVKIKPKLARFVNDYIIDFAMCEAGTKVWVIEINPFLTTTDSALFSWEHERDILEGAKAEVVFRVVEKPRPGAKAMLPSGMRDLIQQCEIDQQKLPQL